MSTGEVPSFKVVLVGDAKVGKTSVLGQWARSEYSSFYEPTVSPELTTKEIVLETSNVRLQVWDIGFGEADFVAQFPQYARGASGVLLMYDLADGSSVDGLAHWREQVKNHTGAKCAFIAVGCKSDLPVAPGVRQKAKAFCDCFGFKHIETSAQTGSNTAATFATLATECLRLTQQERRAAVGVPPQLPSQQQPSQAQQTLMLSPGGAKPRQPAPAGRPVKLVLLGDARVGKSCLAQRVGGTEAFEEEYIPTAGPEVLTQNVYLNGVAAPVKLQIWDVAGNDILENSRISTPVLQGIQAAMVIYDVTSRGSFESLDRWFRLLEAQADPNISVMLVANKVDADRSRTVTFDEGRNFAEAIRVPYAEVSSRTGTNCTNLAELLLAGGRAPVNWELATAGGMTSQAVATQPVASIGPTASVDKGSGAFRRPVGVPPHIRTFNKAEPSDTSSKNGDSTPKHMADGVRPAPQVPQFGTGETADSFPVRLPVHPRGGSQRITLQEAQRQASPKSRSYTLQQNPSRDQLGASRMASGKATGSGAEEAKNWMQRTAYAYHSNTGGNSGGAPSQQGLPSRSPPPIRPGSPTSRPKAPPQASAEKDAAQRRYSGPMTGSQDVVSDSLSQSTNRIPQAQGGYPSPAFGRGGLIQPNSSAHLQRNNPTPLSGNRVRRAAMSPPAPSRPLSSPSAQQLEQQQPRPVVGGMARSPASMQVPMSASSQATAQTTTARATSPRRGASNYVWRK